MRFVRPRVLVSLAILAAAWEIAGRAAGAPELLPPLSVVFERLIATLSSGAALEPITATLWKTALSLLFGCAAGIAGGLLIGTFRPVEAFFEPLIYSTYSLPRIALIPLFVLWLGLGDRSVVAAASVAVFFLVLINTIEGIKEIEPVLLRAAKNLGATDLQVIRAVLIPGAAGAIFSAVRLGVGQALISVVAGEIIIGNSGLGYWIWNARYRMDTALVFVNLVFLAAIGFVVTWIAADAGNRMFRWRKRDLDEIGL